MNLADAIVAIVILAILVAIVPVTFGFIEYYLVAAENHIEANKFLTDTLEGLIPLAYADLKLTPGTHDSGADPAIDLPAACRLKTAFNGTRSYTVNTQYWDTGNTYQYKEIIATVTWAYHNNNNSISMGVLKRDEIH